MDTEPPRRDSSADADAHELRSYGRRRGRTLSARQKALLSDVLPRLSLDLSRPAPPDLTQLFGAPVGEVWLEIGFGGGEHLIWQAAHNPHAGFIGCEPFEGGVVKVLSAVAAHGLANVRVHADDARSVLRWLPPGAIARAFILFPDPWPKQRHAKRRLVAPALLDQLARVLRPGAELRIATDIGDYARTALLALNGQAAFYWAATSAGDWRNRPADWPQTRYEAKALREGRQPYFFTFVRV